ncbi:MAG: monovalent cation:proton antiporter-2 (CPA2) family protein [Desulforhopalus sp.]|nr:monovalent cation:proton antiporter-2 (CPA2) family protein [Desulforhopalus sp.]
MDNFLLQLLLFCTAAIIAVPLARKCGLSSVLGYLLIGIVIGPFGLSLIGDVESVMHFTEFGVVMMLFLIGLELKPSLLWRMRTPILGMGGVQVVGTALVICLIGWFFIPWQKSLALGLTVSLSSTAIVLQTMREKGTMETSPGRAVFSILLFQDLAVIPILGILPLLALSPVPGGSGGEVPLLDISTLPTLWRVVATLGAIGSIFVIGKYLARPIFRTIAATRVREIFIAVALAMVVGISLLMTVVGLSPALGAFLAGLVLADNEYRYELESDIDPFKGLLLGVFFISVGASLDFLFIRHHLLLIAGLVVGLLLIKGLILYGIGFLFHTPGEGRSYLAAALCQGGEFAFVLFEFSRSNGVLTDKIITPCISAVTISMFLSPLFFILQERLTGRSGNEEQQREADAIKEKGAKVILSGFGKVGADVGRFLLSTGIRPVIVDPDAGNVATLRRFGFEVYYGDVGRLELLEAAGAAEAELLVVTDRDTEKAKALITLAREHFPQLKIAASAADRSAAYDLMDIGVSTLRRETFGGAIELGREVLVRLGFRRYDAYCLARLFRHQDEAFLPKLYHAHRRQSAAEYQLLYRRHNSRMAALLQASGENNVGLSEKAWAAPHGEE